jgi:hypothetical protein
MLTGCLLAILTYIPIYMAMRHFTPLLAPGQTAILWADLPAFNLTMLVALVFLQVIYVTMVYGPIAAFLVELFPTKIRYTSMSLPYHLGNGWFGGFLPLIATAVAASQATSEAFGGGAIYAGLIYPIAIALITLVVGGIFIRETKDHKIDTAIHVHEGKQEAFDWNAVLIALGIGLAALLVAGQGFWIALVGAMALFALPTIFFRLECARWPAIGLVLACLALTAAIGHFVYPQLVAMGGMFRFFAFTLLLGIYTVLLAATYFVFRPKSAAA